MERPWLRHYDAGVPAEIDYPRITLPEMFDRTAAENPQRVATVFSGAGLRYRDVRQQIDAFAAGLRVHGVEPGERVALMLPNLPQFLVGFYGALKAGAVVVPTNPLYTQHELEHQLSDAGASVIVTLDRLFERVQAALPATRIDTVVVVDLAKALPRHLRPLLALQRRRSGERRVRRGGVVHLWEDFLRGPAGAMPAVGPEDVAVLQYTGGTTGTAKGAMLTHANLVANAMQALSWQGAHSIEDLRVLCAVPFFHVYGLTICLNAGVLAGATLILAPRFVPKEVVALARKYRPQVFPGVPTMYVALSDLDGVSRRELGSLRVCLSGAAPLPMEVQRRFHQAAGVSLVEGYGLTEAGPVTHCNPVSGGRPGTIGVPFPDTDAAITDPETWEPLPPGTVGELTVAGPQVMQGYWNRPEETAAVLRDGRLHTGDLATMDEDGYFRVVDRKKDLIIAGGYNVYPREVEDVLYGHPSIREASVIGVPSAYRGETVKAVVVLQPGARATEEEIIAYCRQELAAYKIPRIVEFRDELPMTLVGKVLRRQLRAESLPTAARQDEEPVA